MMESLNKVAAQVMQLVEGCCPNKDSGFAMGVDYSSNNVATISVAEGISTANARDAHYTEWESIRKVLANQDIVLIRGNWLEEIYRRGDVLPRRQDLPAKAIWSAEDLMLNVRDQRRQTPQLLSISYTWLTREHPDPEGFHLRMFAPLLKHYARHKKMNTSDIAIFVDYCSLPQRPRSPAEEVMYRQALNNIDLWYSHSLVEVWLLTRVPDGVTPFEERGWPKFERALATLVNHNDATLDLGLLRYGWRTWTQVNNDCHAPTRPPELPETFTADLANKAFAVREDEHFLSQKYREVLDRLLGQEAQLWYANLGWSDREAQDLAQILPFCGRALRDLELRGNDIANLGAAALAEALPLCDALERLSLEGNCISKEAQQVLRDAWVRTGKPKFGLEIGEQNLRPRGVFGRDDGVGGRGGASPGGGGSGGGAASEQLNQLLARQAAFEARIESSVARLTDGLVEVADAVGARQRRVSNGGSGPPGMGGGFGGGQGGYSPSPSGGYGGR
mmetsp:Transcript_10341/g.22810  ORF Transcript_10341/g.22810 Transcript_10341/m.22810 type:complete len:505 (-) Transcript_10341:78-1592(-)